MISHVGGALWGEAVHGPVGGIIAGAGVGKDDYSHIAKFVECVRDNNQHTAATIGEVIRSNISTELGNVSLLTGEAVKVAPKTVRLADPDSAAAKFWNRTYEPGWEHQAQHCFLLKT